MRAFAATGSLLFALGALVFIGASFFTLETKLEDMAKEKAQLAADLADSKAAYGKCQVSNEILTHALQTDSRINEILERSDDRS